MEECVNDTYLGVWNTVPPQQPDPLRKITRNLAAKLYHTNTAQKRNSHYDVALNRSRLPVIILLLKFS